MFSKIFSRSITAMIISLIMMNNMPVYAEEAANPPVGTVTVDQMETEVNCHEFINQKLEGALDNFFTALLEKNNAKAYQMTSKGFRRNVKRAEFDEIVSGSGLASNNSKIWFDFDGTQKNTFITFGEFTQADGITIILRFTLKMEDGAWKLDTIAQIPMLGFFKKIMPSKESIKEMIAKEIQAITAAQNNQNYNAYYRRFAKSSKGKIKLADVKKALSKLKELKLDITLPDTGTIHFKPCLPGITSDGTLVVTGDYKNEGFTVNFTFSYAYEWVWKLNGFNIDGNPFKKGGKL